MNADEMLGENLEGGLNNLKTVLENNTPFECKKSTRRHLFF